MKIEKISIADACAMQISDLADWVREAGAELDKAAARDVIHGMPFAQWKALYQGEATTEQLARMEASLQKNAPAS